MGYIAHIRKDDNQIQTVDNHLKNVGEISYYFGEKIGLAHLTRISGLLHDMGKYSEEFKEYILDATNNPDHLPKKGSVDHSTAGAKWLYEKYYNKEQSSGIKITVEILINVIISHHSGLRDYLTPMATSQVLKRVEDKELEYYEDIKRYFENQTQLPNIIDEALQLAEKEVVHFLSKSDNLYTTLSFITMYAMSCLIDADRLDSKHFEEKTHYNNESNNTRLFERYYQKLSEYLNGVNSNEKIDQLRTQMSLQCDNNAKKPSGVYTLSIPTGGGKTLSSLRYALKHANIYNKKRIIYVVPFTTIIEQNAQQVRNILEDDENILEFHSNIVQDENSSNDVESESLENYEKNKRIDLAKENWDAPIIFTTMVQYLNAFYSSGTQNIRRLHNLTNSVVIFDEVQSLPVHCVSLFNETINFLRDFGKSSVLLCTATQPALEKVNHNIKTIDGEIVHNLEDVNKHFKRTEIVDKTLAEGWNTSRLGNFVQEQLEKENSILVVLNTKTVVKKLYQYLIEAQKSMEIIHLSTSMCAEHRKKKLEEARNLLESNKKVVVVSTQLIEAGVDISFQCVIRSLSGLDSIAQAAGRCNRNSESEIKKVYVIDHNEENLVNLKTIKRGAEITEKILKDITNESLFSSEIMSHYFENYYSNFENELDYRVPSIKDTLYSLLTKNTMLKEYYENKNGYGSPFNLKMSFNTLNKHFNVIDDVSTTVVVPYKEGEKLIADLNEVNSVEKMQSVFQKLQPYSISIYEHEMKRLSNNQKIQSMFDGKILVLNENAYDNYLGLLIDDDAEMDISVI